MRRAVLAAFGLLVATTQVVWLTYAPVASTVHDGLGVSEGAVGDLAVIFPIVYVLVSLPAGRLLDAALKPTLAAGAALTAVGALIRVVDPRSYGWALAGQVVLALAQPVVLNAITAVATRWFDAAERATAIALASAAQFVGILAAAVTAQPLVDAGGLRLLVVTHAALAVVAALAMIVALRVPVLAAPASTAAPLRADALLWTLAAVLFIGFGLFNALATWLDTLYARLGSPGNGGVLTAVLTVAGVVGAALAGPAVARSGRRRAAVATIGVVTAVGLALLAAIGGSVGLAAVTLAVVGFVLLAGLPVALDWADSHVGPARTARATSLLLLAGNLGGAILVVLVQGVLDLPRVAFLVMAAVALPVAGLARWLPSGKSSGDSSGEQVSPKGLPTAG